MKAVHEGKDGKPERKWAISNGDDQRFDTGRSTRKPAETSDRGKADTSGGVTCTHNKFGRQMTENT